MCLTFNKSYGIYLFKSIFKMVLFTCQSGDLAVAKECATKCVHLAAPIAKSPSTFEEMIFGTRIDIFGMARD
jgi:hypothetical protein